MNRVIQVGKTGLLFSGILLCLTLAWCLVHAVRKMDTVAVKVNSTLDAEAGQFNATLNQANTVLGSLNATIQSINRPCGLGRPCGTLADIGKTLNTVRGTFGEIEIAANHEDRQLSTLDSQEKTTYSDLHTILSGVPPVLASLNADAADIGHTNDDLDKFISSPEMAGTIHNLNVTSGNFAKTSGDFQTRFHDLLFPPPCKTKWCEVKKAWPMARDVFELSEPTYYFYQIMHGFQGTP